MVSNNRSNDDRKIIVRQLDFNTTETTIQEYFSQYGHVSEMIMKYNEGGRSKGFCFVVFNDKETMEEVLKSEHEIDGRKVQTRQAGEIAGANQTNKLFCGGLPHAVTEDDLRQYFVQFGEITNFEFIYDKTTQERKHFCFVLFQEPSSVEKIVEGKLPPGSVIHHIGTYRVECKKKFEDNHPVQKKVKYATNQKKSQADDWGWQEGSYGGSHGGSYGGSHGGSYGGSHGGYSTGYAPRAAPRRARGGVRGRARGARAATHSAYPGYASHAAYEDPYAASYDDPYAAADPYAEDPYAASSYAAGYEEEASGYSSYAGYETEHIAPRAGGGPMKSRSAARGVRGVRSRGSYPAPY